MWIKEKYNLDLVASARHHRGKVWGEGLSRHLGEVKALREGHNAVQLPSAEEAPPKPFQVQAQDARQRAQLEALARETRRRV